MKHTPVLLTVFDGVGVNPNCVHNAWALARTPHLYHYFASNPHSVLQASGLAVGLPHGQFGNSEVEHLTLGAGRVLEQDLVRIAGSIYGGTLAKMESWRVMLQGAKRLHLVGLISDGGVHSFIEHLTGILPILANAGIEPAVHMITDGRDTAPRAALGYLTTVEKVLAELGTGTIATVSGRYCAMDCAKNWDRTEKAWSAMVLGQGMTADSPRQAIESAYTRGKGDEWIQPTVIVGREGIPHDEPVLFLNIRSSRARELAAAFALEGFDAFDRGGERIKRLTCMTEYSSDFPFPVRFEPQVPEQVLAEVPRDAGERQLHCSETEKFPHVT